MFSSHTQEMLRRKAEQQADLQQAIIEVELQRRRFLNLQLPDMENDESIHHHQRSLSIGSPAHFPPRFSHSHLFQSENNGEEITEGCLLASTSKLSFSWPLLMILFFLAGDRDTGEKHPQLGATSSEERGYSNDFYKRYTSDKNQGLKSSCYQNSLL